MNQNCTYNNNKVILIDPNCVNVNTNLINAIPQYQDMHIYAELLAFGRNRTVLVSGGGGKSTKVTKINLLGINLDKESTNYEKFTTNY